MTDFGNIRSLTHDTPTAENWSRLCETLLQCDKQDLTGHIIPYVSPLLERWDSRLRVLPPTWFHAIISQDSEFTPELLSLIRNLDDSQFAEQIGHHPLDGLLNRMPHLGQITHLSWVSGKWYGVPPIPESFLQFSALHHIKELYLRRAQFFDDAFLIELVEEEIAHTLEVLDLSYTAITDDGLLALLHSPMTRQLRELRMAFTNISSVALQILAESSNFAQLEVLDVLGLPLSERSEQKLREKNILTQDDLYPEGLLQVVVESDHERPTHHIFPGTPADLLFRKVKHGDEKLAIYVSRGDKQDIQLPSSSVSNLHCMILRDGDRIFVKDLLSRNGTYLDGQPIGQNFVEVSPEQEILIAPYCLRAFIGPIR